jgi:hypothetical protein
MIELKDRLYTSTEVADILGVSLRSVYRYLEEDKLHAEVKTATGRHRFTKKNILDFLYPEGVKEETEEKVPIKVEDSQEREPVPTAVSVEEPSEEVTPQPKQAEPTVAPKVPTDEEVDWLAKFREAAAKFKEEEEKQKVKVSEEPAFVQEQAVTGISGVAAEPAKEEAPKEPEIQAFYYRSALGGLKEIAQNIDKTARNANNEYAFTLNAGLSLYKPIQPFSLLHAYVKSSDREFYEKMLQLTPADESNAQLALFVFDDPTVYSQKQEVHGLYVVSKQRLNQDINNYGDDTLKSEGSDILS